MTQASSGWSFFKAFRASRPFMPGIIMSMMAASNGEIDARASASCPFAAGFTSCPRASMALHRVLRKTPSSSRTSIRAIGTSFAHRQQQLYPRLPRRALYPYLALKIAHYPVAHGEPQASALAHRLCGEEGLEDPLYKLPRYAGALVLYRDAYEPVRNRGRYVDAPVAVVLKGLYRVLQDIEEDLPEAVGVCLYGPERRVKRRPYLDRLFSYKAALREAQEVVYYPLAPVYLAPHVREVLADNLALLRPGLLENALYLGGEYRDGAQGRVELVRYACRELAYCRHLLDLLHELLVLYLYEPPARDVHYQLEHAPAAALPRPEPDFCPMVHPLYAVAAVYVEDCGVQAVKDILDLHNLKLYSEKTPVHKGV